MYYTDIPNETKKALTNYAYEHPFTEGLESLDVDEVKKICLRHDPKANYQQVKTFLSNAIHKRREYERRFLEDGCKDTEKFPVTHPKYSFWSYPEAIQKGLKEWDGKTPDAVREEQFEASVKVIKDGKHPPSLHPKATSAVKKRNVKHKNRSKSLETAYAEGRRPHNEGVAEAIREIQEEHYGGNQLVQVYEYITGTKTIQGVDVSFNVDHNGPSSSVYHGFTIRSGGGLLAAEIMKNQSEVVNQKKSPWSVFVYSLRRYGMREDICNDVSGKSGSYDNVNMKKFIFYHESMYQGNVDELRKLKHNKVLKTYLDEEEEAEE